MRGRALFSVAVAATAVAAMPAAPARAGMARALSWGSEGFANHQFGTGRQARGGDRQYNSPGGIVVDRAGNVWVADTSNNYIKRFSPNGAFLKRLGRPGWNFDPGSSRGVGARGGFLLPQGLAMDSAGNLFVADNRNDRVVKWSTSGGFLARLGRRGSVGSQLISPWGIAVSGSTVYVVDQGNFKIKKWSTSGAYRGAFGSFGLGAGQLRAPYGIAVTGGGTVFVSDPARDQIYKYTSGGRLIGVIGGPGGGPGQFNQPAGLAIDSNGTLLVADCANQRVQRLSQGGGFIDSFGRGALRDPTFVAAGPGGKVYVSDYRQVVRFDPVGGPSPQGGPPGPIGRLACTSQAEGARPY